MLNPPVLTATIGTFTDLNNLVKNGGTITLTQDYAYNSATDSSYKNGVALSKASTIIYGNGHKIDAKGVARIFRVTGNNIQIYNLTFYNATPTNKLGRFGAGPGGGGIYCSAKNLFVKSSRFEFCSASSSSDTPMGVAVAQNQYYATYTSCIFVNNSVKGSTDKASIIHTANYNDVGLNFTNCIIVNNSGNSIATFSGYTKDVFNNNVFFNNIATSGTVIYRVDSGSNFNYNWYGSNNPKFDKLIEGGMVAPTWIIMNFTNTTPFSISGGSVNLRVFLNAVFNHTAKKYQPLVGGIAPRTVYYSANVGSFNVTSEEFTDFSNVKFTYPAGATNITITAKVDNQILFVRFYDNIGTFTELQALIDSTPNGGTISLTKDYYYDSRYDLPLTHGMTINKPLNIIGNGYTISGIGDARIFQITGSYVNISNTTFANGYAVSTVGGGYYGAAIYGTGSYLKITQCAFENNTAASTSTSGGVVYMSGTGSSFEYNSFYKNTGKVYVSSKVNET